MDSKIHLSSSPHFSSGLRTNKIMLAVIIAMLPECIAGIVFFGIKALISILVSIASCVLFEYLFQKTTKQKVRINNLSAVVSGILLALVCPPTVSWWMLVLGGAVAMIIAKGLFGGIGSNVFNPALTGRAFLFLSFPAIMGAKWIDPVLGKGLDAITSATALSAIKSGAITAENFDFLQFFIGNRAGCIGETSILLILISFVFLAVLKVIDWRAPAAMVGTASVLTFLADLISTGSPSTAVLNLVMYLLTGGLLFGATFMITDYATAPVTKPGRLIFGAGAGLITFLIRRYGGYPEGVMFSILIMNAVAPFLNNLTVRMYGYGKKGHRRADVEKISMEFDLSTAKERPLTEAEVNSETSVETPVKEDK